MPRDRASASAIAAAIVLAGLAGGVAAADQVRGYVELSASDTETRRETPGDTAVESKNTALSQRFNLVFDRKLFPNLRMRAGGLFERIASTFGIDDDETKTTLTKLRPHFRLELRTPIHIAELGYERSEDRLNAEGLASSKRVREVYSARLGYFPDALPEVRLEYFGTRTLDGQGLAQDTSENRFQLSSEYSPNRQLRLTYRGTFADRTDKLDDNEFRESSHSARVVHSGTFWKQRARISADYRADYRSNEVTASGTGELRFNLPRLAGFSSLLDDPEMGTHDSNPALIDGNLVGSAGINLGLPGIGDDDRARNFGLDLATETELNRLLVWVDQDLPPGITSAFAWDVYVSEDRDDWTFHERVSFAAFGPFLRRFEIEFTNVATRYVKLVASPLTPAVPFATDYPSILITELQAELSRQADEIESRTRGTNQILNLGLRTRILDTPTVSHELTYFVAKNRDQPVSYSLTNGLSLNQRLSRVYTVNGRISQTFDEVNQRSDNSLRYSASLQAKTVEALRQRVVVSGRKEGGDQESDSLSIFLANTVHLYRGVDLNFDVGKSRADLASGGTSEGVQIKSSATLVPHRTVNVNILYRDSETEISGDGAPGTRAVLARSNQVSVAYNPLATLYLFGSQRVEKRTDVPRKTFSSYTVNWSPFPDGTLQFGFRYSETLRSEDDAEQRTVSPRLHWNFARGSYFNLAYQKLTTRAISQRVDNNILSGNLRFVF